MPYVATHAFAILATLAAGLFAGASLHVALVEHPARMACDPAEALAQWRPSFRRASRTAPVYALIALVFGVATWWNDGGVLYLIAGLLLAAVIPYTVLVIGPTNRKLLDDPKPKKARTLLKRWGRLHWVRTALGVSALVLMLLQGLWVWGL
jgi:hypothetical protein